MKTAAILLEDIPVQVERRRVKYARIVVDRSAQVRLIAPTRLSNRSIQVFLNEKQDWIRRQRAHFQNILRALPRVEEGRILYRGEIHRVEPVGPGQASGIDAHSKIIYSEKDLTSESAVEDWYRQEARRIIPSRVLELARQVGLSFGRIFIRGQRTRWGSCSSSKNLSFNWRLVKAPDFVLDYVIVHELIHTEIMDHQSGFWERLASVFPEWKRARIWLRSTIL